MTPKPHVSHFTPLPKAWLVSVCRLLDASRKQSAKSLALSSSRSGMFPPPTIPGVAAWDSGEVASISLITRFSLLAGTFTICGIFHARQRGKRAVSLRMTVRNTSYSFSSPSLCAPIPSGCGIYHRKNSSPAYQCPYCYRPLGSCTAIASTMNGSLFVTSDALALASAWHSNGRFLRYT